MEHASKVVAKRPAGVYRFEGTYTLLKNGKGRFSGETRKVRLP
jgi:hypothetical protein